MVNLRDGWLTCSFHSSPLLGSSLVDRIHSSSVQWEEDMETENAERDVGLGQEIPMGKAVALLRIPLAGRPSLTGQAGICRKEETAEEPPAALHPILHTPCSQSVAPFGTVAINIYERRAPRRGPRAVIYPDKELRVDDIEQFVTLETTLGSMLDLTLRIIPQVVSVTTKEDIPII
eukprot:superscaffoldBa00001252_g9745